MFLADLAGPIVEGAPYAYIAGTPGGLRLVHQYARSETILGSAFNSGPRAVLFPHGPRYMVVWDGVERIVTTPPGIFHAALNREGVIAFTGSEAIYLGTADDFRAVVRRGDPAPGLPADDAFEQLLNPTINDGGQIAFMASSRADDHAWGIWAGAPGNLWLVARDGQEAAGLPGYRYDQLMFDIDTPEIPPLSGAGHVAFSGEYVNDTGGVGHAVWLEHNGEVRLIAASGQNLLGSAGILEFIDPQLLSVNAVGQVVFTASTSVAGYFGALLAADANGELMLIARKGGLFQVAPGDVREIKEFFSGAGFGTGGQDGRSERLNDAGQLVFRLEFTDGTSGIFLTTIPEPSVLALASICLIFRRHSIAPQRSSRS